MDLAKVPGHLKARATEVQQLEASLERLRQETAEAGEQLAAAEATVAEAERELPKLRDAITRAAADVQAAEDLAMEERAGTGLPTGFWKRLFTWPLRQARALFDYWTGRNRAAREAAKDPKSQLTAEARQEFLETFDLYLDARTAESAAIDRVRAMEERQSAARGEGVRLRARRSELEDQQRAVQAQIEIALAELVTELRRYEESTTADQQLARLRGAARKNHLEGAARFELRGTIVAKPDVITQDAFATNPSNGVFAIADGVTNSQFPGEFARELVRAWVRDPAMPGPAFDRWLSKVQKAWTEAIAPAVAEAQGKWYNAGTRWEGYAAFVGTRLVRGENGKPQLSVLALGDSIAVQVRGGKVVRAFPLERSSEFSNEVQALGSASAPQWEMRTVTTEAQPGDEVFLLTDAIGSWALREAEAGRNPFPLLRRLDTPERLQRFVDSARNRRSGKNRLDVDDTTIVRFVVPEASQLPAP